MAVTSHVYPLALNSALTGGINFTGNTMKMGLCTGAAATWGATQEAFQFVNSFTAANTEVVTGGYARVTLASLTLVRTGNVYVWSCTSPISFGTTITLAAASAFIFDSSIGGGVDSATPLVAAIDFGGTVTSTASNWTYTVDPVNGLAAFTLS